MELMEESDPNGQEVPPSEKDLDVAFVLADADKSGLVDLDEFTKLYKLIKVHWCILIYSYPSVFLTFVWIRASSCFKPDLIIHESY